MRTRVAERRFNPLSGEWVLVSRGRNKRPWTGQIEETDHGRPPVDFDSRCALCPGNARINGERNPAYSGVYVFDNDFPALSFDGHSDTAPGAGQSAKVSNDLFAAEPERGTCRVVCFSENHSATLARMQADQVVPVIECLVGQTDDLFRERAINHVQIFENHGETMGCSNPHPHGQIWAQHNVPTVSAQERRAMQDYYASHRSQLLSNYLAEERSRGERIVCQNESFAAVVPFWAAWPFETLVIPKRPVSLLTQLRGDEIEAFADILCRITVRYDNLFRTDFPYSSGIHQGSSQTESRDWFQLHMHFYPPLLRSKNVRKFMVGYEMLAEAQREISPEKAASILRDQSENHYLRQWSSESVLACRDDGRVPHST